MSNILQLLTAHGIYTRVSHANGYQVLAESRAARDGVEYVTWVDVTGWSLGAALAWLGY